MGVSALSSRRAVKFTPKREGRGPALEPPKGSGHVVLPVFELCGDPILASRRKGEQMRPLFEQAAGLTSVVILDFAGTEVVTTSFFMGGPWALWEREQVEQYPLLANLPEDALDDIDIVTRMTGNPVWTGLATGDRFHEPALIGDLEEADGLVISRIFERGSTSAADMVESGGRIGATGWNNRLAALWHRKVLMRVKTGRLFVYTVPWKGGM
jgi:hypothetical protein